MPLETHAMDQAKLASRSPMSSFSDIALQRIPHYSNANGQGYCTASDHARPKSEINGDLSFLHLLVLLCHCATGRPFASPLRKYSFAWNAVQSPSNRRENAQQAMPNTAGNMCFKRNVLERNKVLNISKMCS